MKSENKEVAAKKLNEDMDEYWSKKEAAKDTPEGEETKANEGEEEETKEG